MTRNTSMRGEKIYEVDLDIVGNDGLRRKSAGHPEAAPSGRRGRLAKSNDQREGGEPSRLSERGAADSGALSGMVTMKREQVQSRAKSGAAPQSARV